ncbi:MAG: ATP-binding cassette domain-containing protein [Anaerolineae bacterium]|nr:ATP-binding cassette domain-containing protein [Anaerolineae bacterium]
MRVQINDRIAKLLSGEVATSLIRLLLIVFYTVVMIQYDVALTLLSVAMAILNMVALRAISRIRSDVSQRLLTEQGKFTSVALNGLQSIETLNATGTESDFFSRWAGHQAQSVSAEQDLSVYTELLTALPTALLTITNALVLAVGGIRVINGQLSMGELVAFQALVVAFLVPINGIVFLGDRLQLTTGDMTRVDDVMRYPLADDAQSMTLDPAHENDTQAAQSAQGATKLTGLLEIKNLTFGYSKLDPPLIENFELSLRPGSRVALVGGSGSGKSTIAKLVAGVYEPWSGEILFDGHTRAELPRAHIKNSLAMVDQDIYLLEGSIRDNIVMWDNTIAETHVIQAAKDAAIHDDIARRVNGVLRPRT